MLDPPQRSNHTVSINLRHADVENHEAGNMLKSKIDRLLPVTGFDDFYSSAFEDVSKKLSCSVSIISN